MEMVDGDGQLHGTYHWCLNQKCGGNASTHKSVTGQATMPADWADAWHEYAVEYSKEYVAFVVDGRVYSNHSRAAGCVLWETPYVRCFVSILWPLGYAPYTRSPNTLL